MQLLDPTFFRLACAFAFVAVSCGVFGHAFKSRFSSTNDAATWETGVSYALYHIPALIVVAWLRPKTPNRTVRIAGWSFVAGVALFSVSLWVLALSRVNAIGSATPVGGALLMIGWLALLFTPLAAPSSPLRNASENGAVAGDARYLQMQ